MYCEHCGKLIFIDYCSYGNKNYHHSCFTNFIQPKCSICNKGINGAYYKDNWGNTICDSHTAAHCDSCEKFIDKKTAKFIDERYYCKNCSDTSINKDIQVAPIYSKIINIYNKYGILSVPANLPVNILDINNLMIKSKSNSKGVKGLAETSTMISIFRKSYSHKIYILSNLPALEFEAVLAHELLHTWLNQYDIDMSDANTEGFCNLGYYLCLSLTKGKHNEILMKNMLKSRDPIYGEGFRKMLKEVQMRGWQKLVEDLKSGKIK